MSEEALNRESPRLEKGQTTIPEIEYSESGANNQANKLESRNQYAILLGRLTIETTFLV